MTAESTPSLSVVVPLYNEEGSLPHLIEQLLAALRPLGRSFEIVLVDDGSRDGTAAVLRDHVDRRHGRRIRCQPRRGDRDARW